MYSFYLFETFKVIYAFVCSTFQHFNTKEVGCPHIRFLIGIAKRL